MSSEAGRWTVSAVIRTVGRIEPVLPVLTENKRQSVRCRCSQTRDVQPGLGAMDICKGCLLHTSWLDYRRIVRAQSPHPSYPPPTSDLPVRRRRQHVDVPYLLWRPLHSISGRLREIELG